MTAPKPVLMPHAKSVMPRVVQRTTAGVKVSIIDTLDSLDNFVVLSGSPKIASGKLIDQGVVRHRDQMATDDYKVSATVGVVNDGRTWVVTCGSSDFNTFYAVEIQTGIGVNFFKIIKGTKIVATTSAGIWGIFIGIMGFIVGFFASIIESLQGLVSAVQIVVPGDVVTVWWDRKHSVVRAYLNDKQVTAIAVSRSEIQHGRDFRFFGVVQQIADPLAGVQFTQIEAYDV